MRVITLALLLLAGTPSLKAGSHPNIVIILVDDMGYGDCSCYNAQSKIPTPAIDSLAQDGMRFTDAHASGPLCHLSRYGLMTGRYPFRAAVGKWRTQPVIEKDQPTLPGMLKAAGYQTAMVGKWHLGFAENGYEKPLPGGPVDRGFGFYFGIRASTDIPPYFYIRGRKAIQPPTNFIKANASPGWSPIQGAFWREGGIAPDLNLKDVLPRFTKEAVSVIDEHAKADSEKPLMLYVAYPAPHTPWLPSKKFLGQSGAGMYGDFAMEVDDNVGQVLDALDRNKMADDTLVLFSSDNGPVWYDEDVKRLSHDSSGGLRGMKSDAWEAGHRMPFIVRWPARVESGTESDQLVSFVDVFATIADVCDVSLSEDAAPDSFSFLPALRLEGDSERNELALQSGGGMMTLRSGQMKLIKGLGSGGFSTPRKVKPEPNGPAGQLYDLAADLDESENLYLERSAQVKKMSARLEQIRKSAGHRYLK